MLDRVMRVVKLDKAVYAEVEADQAATTQAATVVAIVAVASAIGGAIGALIGGGESAIMAVIVALLTGYSRQFCRMAGLVCRDLLCGDVVVWWRS